MGKCATRKSCSGNEGTGQDVRDIALVAVSTTHPAEAATCHVAYSGTELLVVACLKGIVPIPYSSVAIALSSGELHIIQTLVTTPQLNDILSNEWTLAFRQALIDANKDRSGHEWSVRLQGFGGLPCPALGGSVVFAAVHEYVLFHASAYNR
jgi:hypothetical protein